MDEMVVRLLEVETLNKEEIAELFAKVKMRPARPAWTGSATRVPSSQPPVAVQPKAAPVKEDTDEPKKARRVKKAAPKESSAE